MSLTEKERHQIEKVANAVREAVPAKVVDPHGKVVIERQRVCLMEAIREAREAEEKRMDFLDNKLPRSVRTKYEERFAAERARDQEKLDYLVSDYKIMKKAVASGEFAAAQRERSQALRTVEGKFPQQHYNRFEGLENPVDIVFHRTIIGMFDRHDKKFEAKLAPKFNEYAEKKRLVLLEDKRALLHKLVSVQRSEITEHMKAKQGGGGGGGGGGNIGFLPINKGSQSARDTRSVCSSRSSASSSGASWATFASRSSSRGGVGGNGGNGNKPVGRLGLPLLHNSRPKPFVPALPLHTLNNNSSKQ